MWYFPPFFPISYTRGPAWSSMVQLFLGLFVGGRGLFSNTSVYTETLTASSRKVDLFVSCRRNWYKGHTAPWAHREAAPSQRPRSRKQQEFYHWNTQNSNTYRRWYERFRISLGFVWMLTSPKVVQLTTSKHWRIREMFQKNSHTFHIFGELFQACKTVRSNISVPGFQVWHRMEFCFSDQGSLDAQSSQS